MELVNHLAEEYAQQYSSPHQQLLQTVLHQTQLQHPHAHMMSSDTQGKFLEIISRMIQPRRILEIGTFTGFSALCLAAGMPRDGHLHTIELRAEDAATAQHFFSQSAYANQISLHLGNAVEIIPALNEEWDLVFIDADKLNYIEYYELTLPQLKPGGWMIADNVLFHGQVLQEPVKGKNAIAIHRFNEHVKNDPRTEQVMLTVRDGLTLLQKIG